MPNVSFRFDRRRQSNLSHIGEQLGKPGRMSPTGIVPFVQVPQLDLEDRTLNAFHAGVVADLDVMVPSVLSVVAQAADAGRDRGIVGNDGPCLAECTQVLAGIEAKAADAADRADTAALIARHGPGRRPRSETDRAFPRAASGA